MRILDRLYGSIEVDSDLLKLIQTPEISRLRHLSLSAIPSFFVPAGNCATKFEHSLGVAHLAKLVGESEDFAKIRLELICASLAHDCGTPPFSHITEHLLFEVTGKNHEEYAKDILSESDFFQVIEKLGGDTKLITQLIMGEGRFGKILNGSIDLDNLDNSLRYGISMGILSSERVGGYGYSPESLASCYRLVNDSLAFFDTCENNAFSAEMELLGWINCRQQVYEFVQSEINFAAGLMLFRALDLAFRVGKIKPSFFNFNDYEAYLWLLKHSSQRTSSLIDSLTHWKFFTRVCSRSVPAKDFKSTQSSTRELRGRLSDQLANDLGLAPEQVVVYVGTVRGFKDTDLMLFKGDFETQVNLPLMNKPENNLLIQVFIQPTEITSVRQKIISDFVDDLLTEKSLLATSYR